MAKMKQNLGEQPSGKLGNVVFYQRYGKSFVRAAPKKRESYTEEQVLYRQRLSKASALWRSLKSEETTKIWSLAAEGMNNYAWFMKANMPAFAMDGTLIDPKLIKVSDGGLPLSQHLVAQRMFDGSTTINVSWQNDPHTNADRLMDQLWAVSYAEGKFSGLISTWLKRSDLKGNFVLPSKFANASHVFFFWRSANGEDYSPSVCW